MTILSDRWLNTTATLWVRSGNNSFGHSTYSTPSTISVRWEDSEELFITIEGDQKRSKAVVYLDQVVKPGDYLFLGTSVSANPVAGSYEVLKYTNMPGVVGSFTLKMAFLG